MTCVVDGCERLAPIESDVCEECAVVMQATHGRAEAWAAASAAVMAEIIAEIATMNAAERRLARLCAPRAEIAALREAQMCLAHRLIVACGD